MASVIKRGGRSSKRKSEKSVAEQSPVASMPSGNHQAKGQAQEIIEDAQKHHRELVAHAKADVVQMLQDAVEMGEAEGKAQAENMRAEIAQLETRMLAEIENEVVRASLRVAEEILTMEVKNNPLAVVSIAAQGLSTARNAKEVFLRVHPQHAAALRENKGQLIDALRAARDVQIREDKKVKLGGVLIQTESGVIDAQLDTQLEELALLLGT